MTNAKVYDFMEMGGIPDDETTSVVHNNARLVNETLSALKPGDVWVLPRVGGKPWHIMGGIKVTGIQDVVLQFKGDIMFSDDIKRWPRYGNGKHAPVMEIMEFVDCKNVTFTGGPGFRSLWDGRGERWWGIPYIGYLVRAENRPRMIKLVSCEDVLFENIHLKNSPYWTFTADHAKNLEVRYSSIEVRRTKKTYHDWRDLSAFNTDGFDVRGRDVWVHDVEVWNDDDCVAVKDDSKNILFERITASGLGLTIGSIGSSTVQNVTFRDCTMKNTLKGIYMKFRDGGGGLIKDIVYENIRIEKPRGPAIWIGPAQQSDRRNPCEAHSCSICWPTVPFAKCDAPDSQYENILLKNITIIDPQKSIGLIMGSENNPIKNITLDHVRVEQERKKNRKPWGDNYYCRNVEGGKAKHKTWPVPSCFERVP